MLMDVLSGVFTGAAFGGDVRNPFTGLDGPQHTGHFFMALKADLFMPMDTFEARMQTLTERVKAQPRAEGFEEILMPGEPEDRNEQARRVQGIPLTPDVVLTLKAEGEKVGVVTSGGFGASVEAPIAMAYVTPDVAAVDTELTVDARGKAVAVTVARTPFVPPRYYRG